MSFWGNLGRMVLTGKVGSASLIKPAGSTPSNIQAEIYTGRPWQRTLRIWLSAFLLNFPLMLGLLIVGTLIVLAVFAPLFTPYGPLQDFSSLNTGGKFITPPFPPGTAGRYPLGSDFRGRDLWTILLYGARTTLSITAIVVLCRFILGGITGMLAGWFNNTWVDRWLMSLASLSGAFPALLFGMVAILAADIRTGATAFVIGLALTGWSEMAHFIRSEVLVIHEKPYIEGARTTGLTEVALLTRHVLPNILPSLVMMGALEMSAVLIVLGELGFLGILIGGGVLDIDEAAMMSSRGRSGVRLVFNTPEWGALMAFARISPSTPWIAIYGSLAFTCAILGFNLFAEGLRRLLEHTELALNRFFKLRYFGAIAGFLLIVTLIANLTAPVNGYTRMATGFDEKAALKDTRTIADRKFAGRLAGSPEEAAVGQLIADRYQQLGLLPGGDNGSYFQQFSYSSVNLSGTPTLTIKDQAGNLLYEAEHHHDFAEVLNLLNNNPQIGEGDAADEVVFAGWGIHVKGYDDYTIDTGDKVVMLLQGGPPEGIATKLEAARLHGAKAILLVARDPAQVYDKYIDNSLDMVGLNASPTITTTGMYTAYTPNRLAPTVNYRLYDRTIPLLLITRQTADILLSGTGWTADQLYLQFDTRLRAAYAENRTLDQDETHSFALKTSAEIAVHLKRDQHAGRNVIGYIPGSNGGAAEAPVIVGSHYDFIGSDPDGIVYPGASAASGIGVLLEMARLAKEQKIQPHNTIIFIAFSSGEVEMAGSRYYVSHLNWPLENASGVILLDRPGAGTGSALGINSEDYPIYMQARDAADHAGVVNIFGSPSSKSDHTAFIAFPIPVVRLFWPGMARNIYSVDDSIAIVDQQKLRAAGLTAYILMLEFAEQ